MKNIRQWVVRIVALTSLLVAAFALLVAAPLHADQPWRQVVMPTVVDNLNQIKPDLVADFPKLAASAAHVMGRPLVWDEEGGGTGPDGKFVVDYQLVGRTPTMVVGRTFLHPEGGAPDLSFATLEPSPEITARVVAALPPPDVKLDTACPPIKYLHRALADGDVYFFFNESSQAQTHAATLAGSGRAEVWDAASGTIHPLDGAKALAGSVAVPLKLAGHEARFIVLRR